MDPSSLQQLGQGRGNDFTTSRPCEIAPVPHLWENSFFGVPTGSQEAYTNQCRCRGQGLSDLLKNVPRRNQEDVFSSGGEFFEGNLPSISAANYIGSLFFEVFISDPKRGRFDSSS